MKWEWAWVALVLSGVVASLAFITGWTLLHPITKTKIVYANHPKGVPHLPGYDSREEYPGSGFSKVCELYANFNPDEAQGFKVGQRLISDCTIVQTGPKG